MNVPQIVFFDTTCHDGKQAPGNNHNAADTLRIAIAAASMGINVFEAGFAASSALDFASVELVARMVDGMTICSLARARESDIMQSVRALEAARTAPRLHTFMATSDIHLEYKLKMSRTQALEQAVHAVEFAKRYVDDVQFSAEDASRSDPQYLAEVVRAVIMAGARTINLPDTVGYSVPAEITQMILGIKAAVPEIDEYGVVVSVHCHDDLGQATANTLAGIKAGARQVECTVNGIGERAGNTHYAEVAMTLSTRFDYYRVTHTIKTEQIGPMARLVSGIVGKPIADNLATVGEHVFAHGAGIHQQGALANSGVYEIMSPESVGWNAERFPLSSQSGRHGLQKRLQVLGYEVSGPALETCYQAFLRLAETKALVTDDDLLQLSQS